MSVDDGVTWLVAPLGTWLQQALSRVELRVSAAGHRYFAPCAQARDAPPCMLGVRLHQPDARGSPVADAAAAGGRAAAPSERHLLAVQLVRHGVHGCPCFNLPRRARAAARPLPVNTRPPPAADSPGQGSSLTLYANDYPNGLETALSDFSSLGASLTLDGTVREASARSRPSLCSSSGNLRGAAAGRHGGGDAAEPDDRVGGAE